MKKLIFVFGILITGTVFGQTAKFKLTDTTGRWNTGNDYLDSLKQEFIQEEIVKQLNAIRYLQNPIQEPPKKEDSIGTSV